MLLNSIRPHYRRVLSARNYSGFSLLELLTVVAMISVLAGIGSFSLRGNSGSVSLRTAGAQCGNFLESAREAAVLRKTPVAVVFIPATPTTPAALTGLCLDSESGNWNRLFPWEKLPSGVLLDPTSSASANSVLGENAPTVSPALPPLHYAGSWIEPGGVQGYGYLVFLPSGALYQTHSHSGSLRLVEGVAQTSGIQATSSAKNYFEVVVNPSTGRLKYCQPE